jgi:hypothetical protein
MRLLHLTLIAALVSVPAVIVGSNPANAAQHCPCTHFNPSSGICTEYTALCEELPEGAGTFTPFRNTKACRRSQAILCDYSSCKVVCGPKQK